MGAVYLLLKEAERRRQRENKPVIKKQNGVWICGAPSTDSLVRWYEGTTPTEAHRNWFLQVGKVRYEPTIRSSKS